MPWLFTIPEFVKKRACRYLLQHYLGQYLKGKIQLEDLTVDLYNGTGTITNVPLNVEVHYKLPHLCVAKESAVHALVYTCIVGVPVAEDWYCFSGSPHHRQSTKLWKGRGLQSRWCLATSGESQYRYHGVPS